jgi:hypothetical protein
MLPRSLSAVVDHPRLEYFQGELFIAMLIPAIDKDGDARRSMHCAHGRLDFVLVLAATAVAALGRDFDLRHRHSGITVVAQWQHGNGYNGRVTSAPGLGRWHSLHDMFARLQAKHIPATSTANEQGESALRAVDDLAPKAFLSRKPNVRGQQVFGEQFRILSTLTGMDIQYKAKVFETSPAWQTNLLWLAET